MIQCPYCISDLNPSAVACGSCGRDLAGQIHILKLIADLQVAVARLDDRLRGIDQQTPYAIGTSITGAGAPRPGIAQITADFDLSNFLKLIVLPGLILIAMHHLFVLTWNLAPFWLLIATLVIPVPFGSWALITGKRGFVFWTLAYFATAVAVVFVMSIDTTISTFATNADTSLLPSTHGEWVQDTEFTAGLFLSFATGLFLGVLFLRVRHPDHPVLATSKSGFAALVRHFRSAVSVEFVESAQKYVTFIGAVISAIGAIYLGLQRL